MNLSDILERVGRSTEAVALAAEGRRLAEQYGYRRGPGFMAGGNECESLAHLGRYDEARQRVTSLLAADPEGAYAASLLDVRCQIALCLGRYDEARNDLARARKEVGTQDGDRAELQYTRPFAAKEARLLLADGNPDGALDVLRAELAQPDIEPRYDWILVWLAHAIHAENALATGERAAPLDAVIAAARTRLPADVPPQRAYDLMCDGEIARAAGSGDATAWHAAADLWREMRHPYELALCLLRAAEAGAAAGDRSGARRDAAEALETAERIGAEPLVEEITRLARRARLEIETTTGAPEQDAPDLLRRYGLTAREHEVLMMVADGRTNPEIAKALFISPKTASVHVSNILAKLGVTGRVEAATLAQRLQPPV